MPRVPTAKRYAQAAFAIAVQQGRVEEWLLELRRAAEVLKDEGMRAFLEVPKVPLERKLRLLRSALRDLRPLVINLVGLLVARNGLGAMQKIVGEYERFMDVHYQRERAEAVTAVALEAMLRDRLRDRLRESLGKEVILATTVDPNVLGGLLVKVGDKVIDASTKGKLLALKQSLASARR